MSPLIIHGNGNDSHDRNDRRVGIASYFYKNLVPVVVVYAIQSSFNQM